MDPRCWIYRDGRGIGLRSLNPAYGERPIRRRRTAYLGFGVTDIADLLKGSNARSWALSWFGTQPNREEIAKRISPINYVRSDVPPILTIHGDADPVVPYSLALRLHEALTKVGLRNQLLTVKSAAHGDFTAEQTLHAYSVIREFLARSNLRPLDK